MDVYQFMQWSYQVVISDLGLTILLSIEIIDAQELYSQISSLSLDKLSYQPVAPSVVDCGQ